MRYESIQFIDFLQDNGISSYFLHHSIKKKIRNFEHQVVLFNSTTASDEFRKDYFDELTKVDAEITQSIRSYLTEKVKVKTTTDKEILIALKKLKWTKEITEPELREMGLEASLFWSTTILGKLKLVRISVNHKPLYFLLPIGKSLAIEDFFDSHKIYKTKIVETV